jgi:hypothetical protein
VASNRERLAVAVMPAAVLGVHAVRYRLAFGADAGRVEHAHGHAYLTALTPAVAVLAALGVGGLLVRAARAWARGGDAPPRPRLRRQWLLAALALLAVYTGQELLEGALAPGHPAGIAGVVGHGGWWALPAAVALGGAVAFVLGAAAAAERLALAVRPRAARPRRGPPVFVSRGPGAPMRPRRTPLARRAAERAPPAGPRRPAVPVPSPA